MARRTSPKVGDPGDRDGRGRAVGRIVAIVDRLWEETHHEKAAYWGWFECANDREAAAALFDAAAAWAKDKGCSRIIGPMSPSANDVIGTQLEGFEGAPCIMMPYNQSYHDELISAPATASGRTSSPGSSTAPRYPRASSASCLASRPKAASSSGPST